jgi:hypothetical protein
MAPPSALRRSCISSPSRVDSTVVYQSLIMHPDDYRAAAVARILDTAHSLAAAA